MKKRLFATMIALSLTFTGCGSLDTSDNNTNIEKSAEDTKQETDNSDVTIDTSDKDSDNKVADSNTADSNTAGEENKPEDNAAEGESSDSSSAKTPVDINAEIEQVEAKSVEFEEKLQSDMSQVELNFTAKDWYDLWDGELNKVWGYLKDTLSKEEMDKLTEEEKDWIDNKDKEIEAAGAEFEGGSMQPMVMDKKGAELTRERVYKLIEFLK